MAIRDLFNIRIDDVTHAIALDESAALLGWTRCELMFSRHEENVHGDARHGRLEQGNVDCMACIAGGTP